MLRLTLDRLLPATGPERVLVVTSDDLAPAVSEELPELPRNNVIGEPIGRNSAPAIALAAKWSEATRPGAVMLVAPSDHVLDGVAFRETLAEAVAYAARTDALITFGVRPTRADSGYGYIELGEALSGRLHRATAFEEKPGAEIAESYVASGRFLWNSGMFVWRASSLLAAIEAHAPEIHTPLLGLSPGDGGAFSSPGLRAYYEACPSISIDYAVMEKASNVAVCVSEFAWCDVGSWAALGDVLGADSAGNVRRGRVETLDTKNCVFYTDSGPIAAVGVEGVVVVRVGDVTMVCAREDAGRVRDLVRALGAKAEWGEYL